jgi:N6-L-threonylcarbamoyladenine synthase
VEVQKLSQPYRVGDVADLCASFQAAIVDVVVDRTKMALRLAKASVGNPTALVIAGGVAANIAMRKALKRLANDNGLALIAPPLALCTDNGAMIAWAGIERLRLGLTDDMATPPRARWPLDMKLAPVQSEAIVDV